MPTQNEHPGWSNTLTAQEKYSDDQSEEMLNHFFGYDGSDEVYPAYPLFDPEEILPRRLIS